MSTSERIYTTRVGSGRDCFICIPEDGGFLTLEQARIAAANLRAQGRYAYIVNHVTGETVR